MKFIILTLFPEAFENFTQTSIIGRAVEAKKIEVEVVNIRDFSTNKHRKVDDAPYGGGAGMVMACQPIYDCITAVKTKNPNAKVIFFSCQGETFTQKIAESFSAQNQTLILLCGHYEGIDQRVVDLVVDQQISIGNFVLTGGELPAQILVDAVSRLLSGVLGKEASAEEESFSDALEGKKEYPHYTRPEEFMGKKVPEVLLSGHHAQIQKWKKEQCR